MLKLQALGDMKAFSDNNANVPTQMSASYYAIWQAVYRGLYINVASMLGNCCLWCVEPFYVAALVQDCAQRGFKSMHAKP